MDWSWQAVYAVDDKTKEREFPKPFGAQKIMNESKTSDTDVFMVLDFSFALF